MTGQLFPQVMGLAAGAVTLGGIWWAYTRGVQIDLGKVSAIGAALFVAGVLLLYWDKGGWTPTRRVAGETIGALLAGPLFVALWLGCAMIGLLFFPLDLDVPQTNS